MMDDLIQFFKNWYIIILPVLTACVQISPIPINPISWLLKWFSKGLNWIGRQINKDLNDKIDNLEKEFKEEKKQRDNQRVKDLRWDILNFANSLEGSNRDEEEYDHIFDIHEEYEELVEKNGRVDRAMNKIRAYYDKLYGDKSIDL